MTQYLDLPSWMAGLMIWALLPWVWWALRRTMLHGANPAAGPGPRLPAGHRRLRLRHDHADPRARGEPRGRARRPRPGAPAAVVGTGVFGGLVACTVYLPGVLTAPVTVRGGAAFHLAGKFATDPLALLASPLPTDAVPGTTLHLLPYAFVAWFLPVLVLVDVSVLRRRWQPLAGLLVFTAVMVLVVFALPEQVGPLRWPLRLQPFLVQAAVMLTAVLVSRYAVRRPSRRRLGLGLSWLVLAGLVAAVRAPALWPGHLLALVGAAAGFVAVWWCLGRPGAATLRAGAIGAAGLTVVLGLLQHVVFPVPPSPERNMPALARDYRRPLPAAEGDVLVVGDTGAALAEDPTWARESLSGSAWYLGPHRVQNGYTTISFRAYRERYCIEYEGSTCPALLDQLFSTEPDDRAASCRPALGRHAAAGPGGLPRSGPDGAAIGVARRGVDPAHGHLGAQEPAPGAGAPGVVVAGDDPGASVRRPRSARFTVRRVPATGGRVVLSRLAWPGYHVTGDVAAAGRRLPADRGPARRRTGRTVTVRYSPPGWPVEVAPWWLAVARCAWSGRRRRAQPPVRRGADPLVAEGARGHVGECSGVADVLGCAHRQHHVEQHPVGHEPGGLLGRAAGADG